MDVFLRLVEVVEIGAVGEGETVEWSLWACNLGGGSEGLGD